MSEETSRQAAGNGADVIRPAHAPGESPQPGDGGSPGGVGSSGNVPIWRPAAPLRQPVLFVNPRSGGGRAVRAGVVGRARELGVTVVVLDSGQRLGSLIEEAVGGGADALGAAGGDGSQSLVAAAASRTASPSCASRPGPATTSRATSASTGATRWAPSTRSPTASRPASTSGR